MFDRLRFNWARLSDAVDGLKTMAVGGLIFLLGVADYMDFVNVRPALDYVLGPDRSGKIMTFLPLVFMSLRFLTKDRPRWMQKWRRSPDNPNNMAAPVDENNQPEAH